MCLVIYNQYSIFASSSSNRIYVHLCNSRNIGLNYVALWNSPLTKLIYDIQKVMFLMLVKVTDYIYINYLSIHALVSNRSLNDVSVFSKLNTGFHANIHVEVVIIVI